MGTWQTLLDVCPYIPIPLMAILFALGLWHEIVRSNRRIAADIKPPSIQDSTLYKIGPSKGYKTQVADNAIGYLT
jgi:hypothetical protein